MDVTGNLTVATGAGQQSGMGSFGELSTTYQDNPYLVWAAVGATVAVLPLSSLLFGRPSKPPPPFLDSQRWQSLALAKVEQETHLVKRMTFSLPHNKQLLGLPAGMCIKVKVGELEQAYNPISTDETPGEVILLVKEYPVGHPEHAMSAALHALQPGASVAIKGPFGSFRYQPGKYKAIGLLAGGTGVTAMINLATVILKNPNDKVKLRLVYASNSMEDMLMKLHLDAMAAGYYGKFKALSALKEAPEADHHVRIGLINNEMMTEGKKASHSKDVTMALYVVNEAPDAGHHVSMGLIDKEMITKYVNAPPSEDVMILVCGPPAFVADQKANCAKLGYENVVIIDDM